jgi:NTP pyrophosphatase (non-canonical NTP hydrolase)
MKDLCLATGKVMPLVYRENTRQLEKWGVQDHEPVWWLAFTNEELGELAKAISEYSFRGGLAEEVIKEAIQTATLCLKIAEMFSDTLVTVNEGGKDGTETT